VKGVMLPSSFTSVLSSALEYSSHLPVSVLVRAFCFVRAEVFLVCLLEDFGIRGALLREGRSERGLATVY